MEMYEPHADCRTRANEFHVTQIWNRRLHLTRATLSNDPSLHSQKMEDAFNVSERVYVQAFVDYVPICERCMYLCIYTFYM